MQPQKTILVIEDETPIRKVLCERLQQKNYAVIEAPHGAKGLQKALQHHPDAILVDVSMPVMDGVTFLEHLRDDAWGKTAKVFILSNLEDANVVHATTVYGALSYCVKSNWRLEDLIRTITVALEDEGHEQSTDDTLQHS